MAKDEIKPTDPVEDVIMSELLADAEHLKSRVESMVERVSQLQSFVMSSRTTK